MFFTKQKKKTPYVETVSILPFVCLWPSISDYNVSHIFMKFGITVLDKMLYSKSTFRENAFSNTHIEECSWISTRTLQISC